MPGGRPTKYKPEYVGIVRAMATLGATDVEIAHELGISIGTIWIWGRKYSEFFDALKCGREACDERVVRSLYHKAVGYTGESVKLFQNEDRIIEHRYRQQTPPDTASMIFWLKNRRPEEWRDRVDMNGKLEHSGQVEHVHRLAQLLDTLSTEELTVLEGVYRKLESGELDAAGDPERSIPDRGQESTGTEGGK